MLEIGKTYRRNDGDLVVVGGLTKAHKNYVWSIQGDWYDQKTGRFVSSSQSGYVLLRLDGPRSVSDHEPVEEEGAGNVLNTCVITGHPGLLKRYSKGNSMSVDEVLRKFQELADTIRAKSQELVGTDLELGYEACASSIERVINEVKEG